MTDRVRVGERAQAVIVRLAGSIPEGCRKQNKLNTTLVDNNLRLQFVEVSAITKVNVKLIFYLTNDMFHNLKATVFFGVLKRKFHDIKLV